MLNPVDKVYHDLLQRLVDLAEHPTNFREDRTGTGTVSIFGTQMRFDLAKQFPILTTKKVFFKGIAAELNWFLRGDTNIKYLLERGCHIWTDWRLKKYNEWATSPHITREYRPEYTQVEFEKRIIEDDHFAQQWGDIGKGYGHQWRNFSEVVNNRDHNISNPFYLPNHVIVSGFDQISWVINEIKTNPESRRLIVSGWNPHEVTDVDLPPCHTLFQFFVQNGKLSCQLYQRSADVFLGVPFNIASYALLTHIVAKECSLELGDFIWTGGDTHLYLNHVEQAKEQLSRHSTYSTLPQLVIPHKRAFNAYDWDDFLLTSYSPHPAIKAPVAV